MIRLCDLTDLPCLKRYYCKYKLRFPSTSGAMKNVCPLHDAESVSVRGKTLPPCDCPPLCNNVDYDVQSSSGDFKAKEFQITPFL